MPWKPSNLVVPWQAFEQGLPKFVDPEDSATFPPALPANYEAQLFFNLGLREVINPVNLDALPYGWRFLAPKPPQVGVAWAVYLNDAGAVTGVSYGNGIDAVQRAAVGIQNHLPRQIQTSQEVDASAYELRVLRINGLSIEGFWLKATVPQVDLIIPYLTLGTTFNNSPIDPTAAYPLIDFLRQLASQAKELLAFPPTPPYRPVVQ